MPSLLNQKHPYQATENNGSHVLVVGDKLYLARVSEIVFSKPQQKPTHLRDYVLSKQQIILLSYTETHACKFYS